MFDEWSSVFDCECESRCWLCRGLEISVSFCRLPLYTYNAEHDAECPREGWVGCYITGTPRPTDHAGNSPSWFFSQLQLREPQFQPNGVSLG